jgi:two-component system cell cycle sensor histidine kinase/response regulator CckA
MDDEDIVRMLLGRMLAGAGYEVELTKEGAEAVQKYNEAKKSGKPFDAVILDLTVPGGMGGKEVLEKLLEIDPEVKAIVSSGYATDPIMSEYKKYGFSAVVIKPYSISQMEEALQSLLG